MFKYLSVKNKAIGYPIYLSFCGSGARSGKMLLERIVENYKIDDYLRLGKSLG